MTTAETSGPPRAGRREWLALAVLALPALLVSIDVFVVLLALPEIVEELGASGTEQLWILDAYGFLLAGFMITMGTLGDRIGRRRLLLLGAAGFAAASVLAAFSTTPLMLIVARALLGVAGATLAPATLGLISTLFRDSAQRAQAIGVWMVCFMGGALAGPLVGGLVLERFWWGAVFLLGVPAMALLLVLGPRLLPASRAVGAGRLDLRSVGLSLLAILPAVYGLKELAHAGLSAGALLALAVGLGFAAAFAHRQRHLDDPLLDLSLFRNRAFATAVAGMHLITLTGAMMMFLTQYAQLVLGYDALQAGFVLVPAALASAAGFVLAPWAARSVRPGLLIAGGMAVAAAGVLLVTATGTSSGLAVAVVGWAVANVGCAPMVTLGTDIVVGSVPEERAGSAAATSETSAELGYAMGIATFGSLAAVLYRGALDVPDGVPAHLSRLATEGLPGAHAAAAGLPAALGEELVASANDAFLVGMHVVAVTCAALLLLAGVLALTFLRHLPPSRAARRTDDPAIADDGEAPAGHAAPARTT